VGWFKALDETGYFEMITAILDGAIHISNSMKVKFKYKIKWYNNMIDKIIKNKLRVIYDYKIEWYKLLNTLFRWLG